MTKKVSQPQRFKQLVVSSRPISWINTGFPFAAGYLATGGILNIYFVVACLYFLIPYNFLIYVVNDVFDYESDVLNPRKNSIEGGLLPPETHKFMLIATVMFNLVFLIYLFVFGNTATNLLLVLIVLGAVSYSLPPLRLKERPFLDSINSSFHFVSPLIFGLALTGWSASFWVYITAFFLWGCASHAFGAVQDINADRQANIGSVATYLGAQKTVRLSLLLYIASAALLLIAGWPTAIVSLPILAYAAMVAPYINLTDTNCQQANKGWRHFLLLNQFTGFVVTLVLITSKVLD